METIDYLRALRRSAWLVVVCVIAGVIGAGVAVERTTPRYTAGSRLIVSGASTVGAVDEISQRELASTRATAFSEIAGTPPAVSDAVTAAGYPAGTPLPSVSSTAADNEPFIDITVNSTDRVLAARVANAFVSSLPGSVKRLDQVATATPIILQEVSAAGVPSKPTSPKRNKDIGLGAVLGLILGIAVALLREVSDRTLRDSDAAGAALGVTILGVVPYESPKETLIAASKPRGIRTEAYRQVRTALIAADQLEGAPPLRRVIITSATAGEGKTSLVANLAKVYARAGHRVVVVDADLRRPKIAGFYDLAPENPGLSDVLGGALTLEDVTVLQDDGKLGIVTAGPIPSNPSEALASLSMDNVLTMLSDRWDIVLIDTPPVLPVADALILAPKVDGVVLVARLGETTVDKLRRARSAVEKVNGVLVGLVPNGAKADDDSAYRYVYGRRNKHDASYIDVVPADAKPIPTTGAPVADTPIAVAPRGTKSFLNGGRRAIDRSPLDSPLARSVATGAPVPAVASLRAGAITEQAPATPARPAAPTDADTTGPLPVVTSSSNGHASGATGARAETGAEGTPGDSATVLPRGTHRREAGRARLSPLAELRERFNSDR